MKLRINRKPLGIVWVVCLAIAGVITIGIIGIVIIVKACDKLPRPGGGGGTNTNDVVTLTLQNVPRSGAGAYRMGLVEWDGGTNFTLILLMPENLLNQQPKTYWITGKVNQITGNATEMQVYENGELVSTNWTPTVP